MAQVMSGSPEWFLDLSCTGCRAWYRIGADDVVWGEHVRQHYVICLRCQTWRYFSFGELPPVATAAASERHRARVATAYRSTHSGTQR